MLGERLTWRAVTNADVAKAPLDLSYRIGAPIHRHDLHLVGRKSLSDSMCAASIVMGLEVPMALTRPQLVEAGDLG